MQTWNLTKISGMDCQNCGCYSGGTEENRRKSKNCGRSGAYDTEENAERVKAVVEVELMIRKKSQKK